MKKKQKDAPDDDRTDAPDEVEAKTGSDEPTDLESQLRKAEEERDRNLEQLQRALADLQNFRRRRAQDLQEARQAATEGMAQELLPVLDNFHLALAAMENSADAAEQSKAVDEGVRMVQSLLTGVLERRGLQEIHGAAGHEFDHEVHEAVGIDPESSHEAGRIAHIVQRGYTLGDKVIRHTRVLIAGETSEAPPANGGNEADQG